MTCRERSKLVRPARLKFPLLDPQVTRELGIVTLDLGEEALGVLAAAEHSSESPNGKSGERGASTAT